MAQKCSDNAVSAISDDPASFIQQRPSQFDNATIRRAPFAGRIGGNQEFVAIGNDAESKALLEKQPDAQPLFRIKDSLDPRGFLVLDTWRQAVVEGLATALLVFVLGATASGLVSSGVSPFASTLYASLVNLIGLSLFIFSAAPMSGGHLNPTITIATCFAGLATVPRAILYIGAQSIGGIIGGYWLRLGLGDSYFAAKIIPGCTVTPGMVSVGELFALEFMFAQSLIFVAFGVGLDPRQAKVFGASLGPILVGFSLALGTLASSLAKPGYTGLSFNPARCLGLMTARGYWQYHWVHWVAPLCAAMVNGFFYHFFPPYVRSKPLVSANRETRSA